MKKTEEYKYLVSLTTAVLQFLAALDEIMKGPSTEKRGQKIAKLSNALELANDQARYFGLHIDYRTDDKKKVREKAKKEGE